MHVSFLSCQVKSLFTKVVDLHDTIIIIKYLKPHHHGGSTHVVSDTIHEGTTKWGEKQSIK